MHQRLQKAICGANFEGWVVKDANGSAGGLFSYWDDEEFDGSLLQIGNYSITIMLASKSFGYTWILSNIYGPHNE